MWAMAAVLGEIPQLQGLALEQEVTQVLAEVVQGV
jgi:hypothetical protein